MRRAGPPWADAPTAGLRFASPLGRLARVGLGVAAVAVAGLAVASTLSGLAAQRTAAQGAGHGEERAHGEARPAGRQAEGQGAGAWEEVREAPPRFVLEGPDFAREPDVYSVRRNVAGGGRLDQMAFGVPHEAGPYLRLTFYRPFDEPVAGVSFWLEMARRAGEAGLALERYVAGARTRAHAPGRFRSRRPARSGRPGAAPVPWVSPPGRRARFHDLGDRLPRRGIPRRRARRSSAFSTRSGLPVGRTIPNSRRSSSGPGPGPARGRGPLRRGSPGKDADDASLQDMLPRGNLGWNRTCCRITWADNDGDQINAQNKRHPSLGDRGLDRLRRSSRRPRPQTRRDRNTVVRTQGAPPLTIRQRSFLDSGPIVAPRSMQNYVVMDTTWRQPVFDNQRGRMGLETMPRRFDPPGRPSPLFEY